MLITAPVLSWVIIEFGYFFPIHGVAENTSYIVQNVDTNISYQFTSSSHSSSSISTNEFVSNHSPQAKWQHLCPYMQYKCNELPGYCIICNFSKSCVYGMLDDNEIVCIGRTNCRQPNVARSFYETKCEPLPHILCLGRRVFRRMLPCDWSSGKSYALTVFLSLFFGGFGVDRFYLGMWIEGLGKLFSFGGLGLWSIVDFILIVSGYIKPPGDAVYW
ncbi:unnamed protein product [Heterobilharzia americana]|nr:unnamed protein product [Heterobilharzia americana]